MRSTITRTHIKSRCLVFALLLSLAMPAASIAKSLEVHSDPSTTAQPLLRQSLLNLDRQGQGPLDAATLAKFKGLIAQYGWPTVTAAGRDGVDAAGDLTLRASNDYDYQSALESAMQGRLDVDINLRAFAVLNDRIEQIHSHTQQFGSLLALHERKVVTKPQVSAIDANPLRDQVGLSPLGMYLKQIQAKVSAGASLAAAMNVPPLSTPVRVFTRPVLRAELNQMATKDQAVRQAWIQSGLKKGSPEQKLLIATDAANLIRLRAIFARHGFPDQAMVGHDGVANAWLLVQHATADKTLMDRAVKLARPLMLRGELPRSDYALLVDRVRLHEGKKQVYGSQFTRASGHLVMLPLADPAHVDQRRAAMGLMPEAEYQKMGEKMYQSAGASQPVAGKKQ